MERFIGRHPWIAFCSGLLLVPLVFLGAAQSAVTMWLLATCVMSAFGFIVVVSRPHGVVERVAVALGRMTFAVYFFVAIGFPPYHVLTSEGAPLYAVVVLQLSSALGVIAGFLKRRRSVRPSISRSPFSFGEYAFVGFGIVLFHWVLAYVVAHDDEPEIATALVGLMQAGPASRAQSLAEVTLGVGAWFGLFLVTQVTTGLALRKLNKSLLEDWEIPRVPLKERDCWFVLAALPVALCLVPSLAHEALLAGVAARLLTLAVGWAFTSAPPQGALKTARLLWRSRPRSSRAVATASSHPSPTVS
jgi:hypothetical protein